jgi:hypothetical protein
MLKARFGGLFLWRPVPFARQPCKGLRKTLAPRHFAVFRLSVADPFEVIQGVVRLLEFFEQ